MLSGGLTEHWYPGGGLIVRVDAERRPIEGISPLPAILLPGLPGECRLASYRLQW